MHVFYICGAVRSAVMLAAVSMLLWRSVLFLPVYGSCFSWTILNLNTIFLFRQFQHKEALLDWYVNEFHSPRILFVCLSLYFTAVILWRIKIIVLYYFPHPTCAGFDTVFVKDMAYYLANRLDTSSCLPADFTHTFLIRDPAKSIYSLYKMSLNKDKTGAWSIQFNSTPLCIRS